MDDFLHSIVIKEAETHNLKKINLSIKRDEYTVISGISGSGKSSLAFDTLFAEGQRRYVESLSAYARQFLGKMEKPKVKSIEGISPSIAIKQKVDNYNKRSTVGTSTEIYDYLKLLYARIGKTYTLDTNELIKKEGAEDVIDYMLQFQESRVLLLAKVDIENAKKTLELMLKQGYTRIFLDKKALLIEELNEKRIEGFSTLDLIVDRFIVKKRDNELLSRMYGSIENAFYEGKGCCEVLVLDTQNTILNSRSFSNKLEYNGVVYEEPSVSFFTFNSPIGACGKCSGYGSVIDIDEDLVIPNKLLSVNDGAIACWRSEKMGKWKKEIIDSASKSRFPIHKPIKELTKEDYKVLWKGNKYFQGIDKFFDFLKEESYKIQYRVLLSKYRGLTKCKKCNGSRLKSATNNVKINGLSMGSLLTTPINKLLLFFKDIQLSDSDTKIAEKLILEIFLRINYLDKVGLGYLTLSRSSSSLSGGESQRVSLATSLGSTLVGSIYILDEPSIGLHSRDTLRLISILKKLKEKGNSLIVVEHDEEILKAADNIIDIGPMAGNKGGEVVFQGTYNQIIKEDKSLTGLYLSKKKRIEIPKNRKRWNKYIEIRGVKENNLKDINIKFPLEILTVVTGVSGSGKSTLVTKCLLPALAKQFDNYFEFSGKLEEIGGNIDCLNGVEHISQNSIGKSSRSNPVTYIKAFDDIRSLMAEQPLSKQQKFTRTHFSFNSGEGRCGKCKGEGEILIDMQFMADIHVVCDNCNGKRFEREILEVKVNGLDISDILGITVDEAIVFFRKVNSSYAHKIVSKLQVLKEVGLGYVSLGQSSITLSGGESQRIKLASYLTKKDKSKLLFIFDEPTTGLHFYDIQKLLKSLRSLIDRGHSVVLIEHHMDVIKCADWIIDIGPEGGEEGGTIVFQGIPEDLVNCKNSYTGKFLKEKLK